MNEENSENEKSACTRERRFILEKTTKKRKRLELGSSEEIDVISSEPESEEEIDIINSEEEEEEEEEDSEASGYLIVVKDEDNSEEEEEEESHLSEADSEIHESLIEDEDPCHIQMSENQLCAISQIQAQYKKFFEKAKPELRPFLMRFMRTIDLHSASARQSLRAKYVKDCVDG